LADIPGIGAGSTKLNLQANLILFLVPAHIPFYPTTSNFIIAVINHVPGTAGYYFTAQQMSLALQKWW